jgi:hypothetical protein
MGALRQDGLANETVGRNITLTLTLITPVYIRQTAKRAMFSESCNEVSVLLRRAVSAGTKINEDKTQAIYFSHRRRPPETHLTLNGRNIPFVNHVKYLGVIFDKRITWRLHLEMTEAKAFRTFIRIYSLFKSERLSAKVKLTLHKALIRTVITCACPVWELAADTYLFKLQRLQNKVLRTFGNFPRCTPVRDMHTAYNLPYVYDYITKLCRKQAEVIRNHENEHVRGRGQGEARYRK